MFIDDILAYSKDRGEHTIHLRIALHTFKGASIVWKTKEVQVLVKRGGIFGAFNFKEGIMIDPQMMKEIIDWPRPINVIEIRSFLGLASYYHRFVKDFLKITSTMTNSVKKTTKFEWTEKCERAF